MPTSVPGQFLQLVAGANTFFPLGPWGWLFFGFWRFFAVLGQLACNHSATMARGAWCPQKCGAWAARSPQMGTQGPAGGGMHGVGAKMPISSIWTVGILKKLSPTELRTEKYF